MKKNLGFTLVETLVAVAVLVLAVTGAFAAAQTGITSSTYSRDQVIAFYLAQEGVEFVRNIRDQNALQGQPWLTGLSSCLSQPQSGLLNVCTVDIPNNLTIFCNSDGDFGVCPLLQKSPTTSFYGYNFGGPSFDTIFRREIQITPINQHEVSVLVFMTWYRGGTARIFQARENLFDWQTNT
ncbi:MAG: prepilin-type N-terminal cleavage/methylation domain-containing protein [Patescibacteria group bacterium]